MEKYESHITLPAVYGDTRKALEEFAARNKSKTSQIEGDPQLGDKKTFFYITFYNPSEESAFKKLRDLDHELIKMGHPPVRLKIEKIVYDSKHAA